MPTRLMMPTYLARTRRIRSTTAIFSATPKPHDARRIADHMGWMAFGARWRRLVRQVSSPSG